MLVVISDLHFIDSTAGQHNISTEAFRDVFRTWIPALLKEKKAKELKVLLMGDIVDLIRTEKWLSVDADDRPWGKNGIRDINDAVRYSNSEGSPVETKSQTEQQCLQILGELAHIDETGDDYRKTILSRNREAFKVFRDELPKEMNDLGIEFELLYLPGNHDRLCNLYPSVRDRLKEALGLTISPEDENWWYPHEFKDEDYGVLARHGHEYDVWNYGNMNNYPRLNDFQRAGQLQVSIGDVIATEFAVKLPWVASQIKGDGTTGSTDDLVARLREIDNVRPVGNVVEWLLTRVREERSDENRRVLQEAIDQVLDELFEIPLVEAWTNPQTHADELVHAIEGPLRGLLNHHRRPGFLGSLENKLLSSLYQTYSTWAPRFRDPQKDTYTQAARQESVWGTGGKVRYLLYGHTHDPVLHPLRRLNGSDNIYINTGTWRERIIKTAAFDDSPPEFVPLNQITYVVFYNPEEKGSPGFDVWTGSSKAKGYG